MGYSGAQGNYGGAGGYNAGGYGYMQGGYGGNNDQNQGMRYEKIERKGII